MSLHVKEKEALRFLAGHLFCGLVAGGLFGFLILATDLSHIWTLIRESSHPVTVLTLLFFGLFVTFGSVGMSVGIMSLARGRADDDDDFGD